MRIIGWMLAVLALAVGAVVFLTWQLLSARSDASADAELTHEATKFRAYVGSDTARPLDTPEELLDLWLRTNLPDTSEAFFTIVDGRAYHRSLGTPPARLDTDLAFVQRISAGTTPQYGWVDSTAGKVRYGVIPVRVGSQPVRSQLVLLEFRDLLAQPLEDATKALALIGLVTLAMAAGACWIVTGRVLAPIRGVRTTAEQIGESDLRRRIDVVGNDDVAQLARTFNTMLDRLEVAFVAQREFVDNAGHELRTPITVIRGHLELMSDDPVDREETRALVLDELVRMNRMVDDLLVLAKSGRPDFLKLEEVNLTELIIEVVAKARPLADRTWRVDETADTTVVADSQRLTQALMQLVSNAVRHTTTDDRIALGSRVHLLRAAEDCPVGAHVHLWVADSGEGVAPGDRERIFERFARGNDQVRTDGAGLGLAIVRSIAQAHGGEVQLADDGTPGARFELVLPWTPTEGSSR
ncbi:HAMP domain-containing sensor histidine kinase [Kribbella italica]|uniref:histidine kinase n=1 Tax=Kribbella italica TaxID=1540520 RepID=A0A7W9JCC3_9ACTN|nr:signal transduction histidine kinase [Kribbella italica]